LKTVPGYDLQVRNVTSSLLTSQALKESNEVSSEGVNFN
jgi:hypothetical protein